MNGLWPIAEWEIPEGGPCCKHMLAKQNVKCTNDDGIRTREEYLLRYGIIHTNEKGVELVDYHRNCVPTKDKGNRCLVYKSKPEEGQFYQQIEEAMYQDRGTKMTLNYIPQIRRQEEELVIPEYLHLSSVNHAKM